MMIVWLFLLMVLTASYTANLTSILTVLQLPSAITGIDSLRASEVPIGYQAGTFTLEYLTYSLGMARSRLVPLDSTEEYERALKLGPTAFGGVAAIVDELPYIELFLAERTGFKIVGDPFMHRGWGFVSTFIMFLLIRRVQKDLRSFFLFNRRLREIPHWL